MVRSVRRDGTQHKARAGGSQPSRLRIIAGVWRGRRITVPSGVAGLRPTGDRVRETLFNWLAPVLSGARCLDLFAGSGALGFEAASRGASEVIMVERDRRAAAAITATAEALGARQVRLHSTDALRFLAQEPAPPGEPDFDLVFVDPPFASGLLGRVLPHLRARVRAGGLVYLESDAGTALPPLPVAFAVHREKSLGGVRATLLRRH